MGCGCRTFCGLLFGWVLSIISCCPSFASVGDTIEISDEVNHIPGVFCLMEHFFDAKGDFTEEEISSPSFQSRFEPMEGCYVDDLRYNEFLWLKVTVRNNQKLKKDDIWFLEMWNYSIGEVTFFEFDTALIRKTARIGYWHNFNERPLFLKNPNFQFHLGRGNTKTFILRVKQTSQNEYLELHLRSSAAFLTHSINEYSFLGIYYGILLIILMFGLYLLFKSPDGIYFYFVPLVITSILLSFQRDGLGFQFIWPEFPALNIILSPKILEFILFTFTVLFIGSFAKGTKSWRFLFIVNICVIFVRFCLVIIPYSMAPLYDHDLSNFLLNSPLVGVSFFAAIIAHIRSKIFSFYHAAAFTFYFLATMQLYSINVNIIDHVVINWYVFNAAILIELVLFSLSIIHQIVFLKRQNAMIKDEKLELLEEKNILQQSINQELEQKVEERTEEVISMAESLANRNIELKTTVLKLKESDLETQLMNESLKESNEKLLNDIANESKARVLMRGVSFDEFKMIFPDKETCIVFLSELKWRNGYKCRKCGFKKFRESKSEIGKRCKRCNSYESPTSGTLFHKLKFPYEKAFYLLYLANRNDSDIKLIELSDMLELRKATVSTFRQKIQRRMEETDHNRLLHGWESLIINDEDYTEE